MEVSHQLFDTVELHNLAPVARRHCSDGFGVGNAKLKRKGLVGRHSRQKDAHRLGKAQPHRAKRLRCLRLQLRIDPDMNHLSSARHRTTFENIVYELRYTRKLEGYSINPPCPILSRRVPGAPGSGSPRTGLRPQGEGPSHLGTRENTNSCERIASGCPTAGGADYFPTLLHNDSQKSSFKSSSRYALFALPSSRKMPKRPVNPYPGIFCRELLCFLYFAAHPRL